MRSKGTTSRLHKIRSVTRLRVAIFICGLFLLFMPDVHWWHPEGENRFMVYLDGNPMGTVDDAAKAETMYRDARRELALAWQGMSFMQLPELTTSGEELIYGSIDRENDVKNSIKAAISAELSEGYSKAYSIKVGETMVSVAGADEATKLLQETISEYDKEGDFKVNLVADHSRELNVLIPRVQKAEKVEEDKPVLSLGGGAAITDDEENWEIEDEKTGFESFEYGIEEMGFSESVEIVEAYLPDDSIIDYEEARAQLTDLQELKQIYKVKSGDTLSKIALEVGLPLDEIIALNDTLENENSIINVDQELLITVPEPELSVVWTETTRDDEVFDLPIEYIYNDSWFTNKSETRQQPSAGYHETVSRIKRKDNEELSREVLYEEVGVEAVAKVVEVGTMVPPTYIKPLSGGRISSGFGGRRSPFTGAASSHAGVDIATPTGTPIWASSGGVVVTAGWCGGYGYLVSINHPDGRQTRYAHLSKIYVTVGQHVSQGQVLAASGSTGQSTGPHLHFEMRIGGVAYNPMDYVNLY